MYIFEKNDRCKGIFILLLTYNPSIKIIIFSHNIRNRVGLKARYSRNLSRREISPYTRLTDNESYRSFREEQRNFEGCLEPSWPDHYPVFSRKNAYTITK